MHVTIQTSPADSHQDGDCFGAVTVTAFHAALRSPHWPHVIHLNADGHLLLANGKLTTPTHSLLVAGSRSYCEIITICLH